MSLDPAWKPKWLAELRSGNYVQGKGCLRSADDKYCCLGVLAKALDAEMQLVNNPPHAECACYVLNLDYATEEDADPDSDVFLPTSWLARSIQVKLADMNDHGEPFSVIADYIEQNL